MSIVWKDGSIKPTENGNYFCKVSTMSGYLDINGFHQTSDKLKTSEYSVPFKDGEWILGSSLLFGAKVTEWLDHKTTNQ